MASEPVIPAAHPDTVADAAAAELSTTVRAALEAARH